MSDLEAPQANTSPAPSEAPATPTAAVPQAETPKKQTAPLTPAAVAPIGAETAPPPVATETPAPKKQTALLQATTVTTETTPKPDDAKPETPSIDEKPVARIAIIIDDEPANRDFLERLVAQADFQTFGAATGAEGKKVIEDLPVSPLIIAIDSELPDMKGIELVKYFRPLHPKSKIIMATMLDDRSLISQAFDSGCDVFLVKPHGFMELFKRLRMLEQNPTVLDRLVFDHNGVRPRK